MLFRVVSHQTNSRNYFKRFLSQEFPFNATEPRPPIDLDPSYRKLLEDVDFSFKRHYENTQHPKETEAWPVDVEETGSVALDGVTQDAGVSERVVGSQWKRKSPEARFGSHRIQQVELPFELQRSMQLLIEETDKTQLRSDAKRLLLQPTNDDKGYGDKWTLNTPNYSSGKEERIMGPREGLAYAAITLPGQISAIQAVLLETKTRMPPSWSVKNIIDFGSQTGAGFWSSLTFFGNQISGWEGQETSLKETSLHRYFGFDNRQGLVALAKRVEKDLPTGSCSITRKQFWRELDDDVTASLEHESANSISISAFNLSQLKTPAARKQMIRDMWQSKAEILIVIDQGTQKGFHAVADAREYLLRLGSRTGGAHVVAPCPHDGDCPLRMTADICSFPQRFERPDFQKKTKHASRSHEDVFYSFVVIRRGERPGLPTPLSVQSDHAVKEPPSTDEIDVHDSLNTDSSVQLVQAEPLGPEDKNPFETLEIEAETNRQAAERQYRLQESDNELKEHIRQSSYHWRRIVYPPMKGSGHVTLDTCTPKGEIARIVIPRSQGKQMYYDARKSSWGDLFPHEPKNGEIIRKRGIRRLSATEGKSSPADKKGENSIESFLGSLGEENSFGFKAKNERARLSKGERREDHRRRKEWRRQSEQGFREPPNP